MRIIYIILISFIAFSCKPTQIIHERVITKTDSLAITKLSDELNLKTIEIINLKTDLKRIRDENSRLVSEVLNHVINYDTGAQVNPQTGQYPIASETITQSKSILEKTIKEQEVLIKEYNKEVDNLMLVKSDLTQEIKLLRDENTELKSKSVPSFHLKSFLWGMLAGGLLLIAVIIFWKIKS